MMRSNPSEWAGGVVQYVACCIVGVLVSCTHISPTLPEQTVEKLMAIRHELFLTEDQEATLRTMLDDYRHSCRALRRHLREEERLLRQRIGNGVSLTSPAGIAQIGLVHQLRAEQILLPLLLRQRARSVLTDEQLGEWLGQKSAQQPYRW